MHTGTEPIRRRPDGSIDTNHYIARGRVCRAAQAKKLWTTGVKLAHAPTFWQRCLQTVLDRPGRNAF